MAVILYIGTVYPEARGAKWISTFHRAGFDIVVLRGRSHEGGSEVWPHGVGVSAVETVEMLDTKFPLQFALARRVARLAASYEPDIIMVRDIFLAGYALYVSKQLGIPCYVDLADNYPEVVKSMTQMRLAGQAGFIVLNQWERYVLSHADGIVVVTPESKIHIMRKHQLRGSSIHVVENAPDNGRALAPSKSAFSGNLVYIGTFDRRIRDIDTVIEGLSIYHETSGESAHLTVYAFEPQEVQSVVLEHGDNATFVTVMPAVENAVLYPTLQSFDAGVVPHCRCPATEYTAPNKIYDYLHAGIRVVCSDNPPLKRIVNEIGGGVTYRCGDPLDFAQTLRRLKRRIEEGRVQADTKVLTSRYQWDVQVEPFIVHLHDTLLHRQSTLR